MQLAPIVEHCGRHALTIDLAGGYIKEYGKGDPAMPLNLGTPQELQAEVEQEPDDDKRAVLKQGIRFTRIAESYREAMLRSDEAALALLERICLFCLGVDCETLAAIFTGPAAKKVSGKALASLDADQLQKKLDWLVKMRIIEASGTQASDDMPETRYNIHPAVRDGFLSGISRDAASSSSLPDPTTNVGMRRSRLVSVQRRRSVRKGPQAPTLTAKPPTAVGPFSPTTSSAELQEITSIGQGV